MKVIRLLIGILTLAIAAQAQTSRGTVSGTVTDPSGAVVTRARVALTHTQKGVRLTSTTNEAGIYRFDALDLGRYELKVTLLLFRKADLLPNSAEARIST